MIAFVAPRSGDVPGAVVLSNHHITDDTVALAA
jgi:hypothetical protein